VDFSRIEWGSVADLVSGLDSLSAVIVALYLSNSAQRVKLRGYVGLRVLTIGEEPMTDLVSLSVTNIGNRSTRINVISIAVGIFSKREAIIPITYSSLSSPMPCPLSDGEEAHWYIPLGEGNEPVEKPISWPFLQASSFVNDPIR